MCSHGLCSGRVNCGGSEVTEPRVVSVSASFGVVPQVPNVGVYSCRMLVGQRHLVSETLHLETRQRVSGRVVNAENVFEGEGELLESCEKVYFSDQFHDVGNG